MILCELTWAADEIGTRDTFSCYVRLCSRVVSTLPRHFHFATLSFRNTDLNWILILYFRYSFAYTDFSIRRQEWMAVRSMIDAIPIHVRPTDSPPSIRGCWQRQVKRECAIIIVKKRFIIFYCYSLINSYD